MRSDSDVEVLPHRARVFINIGGWLAFWVIVLFGVGTQIKNGEFSFVNPLQSTGSPGDGFAGFLLWALAATVGVAVVVTAMMLRANPTPRIVAGKGGVVVVGFWKTRGFAWSEFGAFRVKNYRRNKSTTVAIRAMPPSAPDESLGAVADWLIPDGSILRLDSSLLTIDIAPFVPPFQVTLDRGEEIAKWLTQLRTNPAARPPSFLRVRAASYAKSAVKTDSTAVRR